MVSYKINIPIFLVVVGFFTTVGCSSEEAIETPPNIIFVFTDDHASHSIGAYGSNIKVISWIDQNHEADQPFMMSYHHKAPHRNWKPAPDHLGMLDEMQKETYFEPRPKEELYDVQNDPHELNNLADDLAYRDELVRLRGELLEFMESYDDGVPRLRTPDEFHRVSGALLPNNFLPRAPKHEMFGECDSIYLSPKKNILTKILIMKF